MDDLDVLAHDFGFGTGGKANPMKPSSVDRKSVDSSSFNDVFGGQPKYSMSSSSRSTAHPSSATDFDYDSIFKSSAGSVNNVRSSGKSTLPVYDKPVYDDIFDGLPGLKSKANESPIRFDDDVFASVPSSHPANMQNNGSDLDGLLESLGRNERVQEEKLTSADKFDSSSKGFDDLLGGFASSNSRANDRPIPQSQWGYVPTTDSKQKNVVDDPFVVLETSSTLQSSSKVTSDPLVDKSKLGKSGSVKAEVSSGNGGAFDDLDPFGTLGKSSRVNTGNDGIHSGSEVPHLVSKQEPMQSSSSGYPENYMANNDHLGSFQDSSFFDMGNDSVDFKKSGQSTTSSQYYETGPKLDTDSASDIGAGQFDDIWLTVSEIPLFTQPTRALPPSRPPPSIPRKTTIPESGSSHSSSTRKGSEFSTPYYTERSQRSKAPNVIEKGNVFSRFDELEDFNMGKAESNFDESAYMSDPNMFSAAAASAAAMKDAMDKAEAKFRHAKEVRERESAKATRNKDSGFLERDEQDEQEKEFRESHQRFERERKQKEEDEREQKRRENERLKEIEREKARQAVERATREARERAAAEARMKAERAAVEKANMEARERAERAAVQRAQAEARGRAAADARERAAAAAAAEAREKEDREKASKAAAEAETRRRAERAAVERVTAEARQRAAIDARERAAAGAREKAAAAAGVNQPKNGDDLESFFSSGRASSAPKARTNPISKGGPETTRAPPSGGTAASMKKASSSTNIVDDLSAIFGAGPSAGEFREVEDETEERRRARMERHQRTQERAAKALAEKNQRDLQAQREQEERHRYAEMLDSEIKRWAAGKEGNLRALLSTLQYVLWPECGWQPVSLTDLITGASVKKIYRKATLCIHPDKVQQKGATLQQKYIAEKVFDILKEAWNKFNSEELF